MLKTFIQHIDKCLCAPHGPTVFFNWQICYRIINWSNQDLTLIDEKEKSKSNIQNSHLLSYLCLSTHFTLCYFIHSGPPRCRGRHLWATARPLWSGQVWGCPRSSWSQGLLSCTNAREHSVRTRQAAVFVYHIMEHDLFVLCENLACLFMLLYDILRY